MIRKDKPPVGDFLTIKEVAQQLRINPLTAYKMAKVPPEKGGPPVRRFGRNCIRFPRKRFLKWAGIDGDI